MIIFIFGRLDQKYKFYELGLNQKNLPTSNALKDFFNQKVKRAVWWWFLVNRCVLRGFIQLSL